MKTIIKLFLLAFALIFMACSSKTKITNAKKGKYDYDASKKYDSLIDVSVSLLPIPKKIGKLKEKPKTFFDLRDSIPNTLLKVLGDNTDSAEEIIELIKEPLSVVEPVKPKQRNDLDLTKFKVRLMLSNIKKFYLHNDLMHDNTRLEFLNTTIKFDDSNDIKIYSIDKIENELEIIDLGNLERTNNVTFNTKISAQNSLKSVSENGLIDLSESLSGNGVKDTTNVYDEFGNLLGTIINDNNNSLKNSQTSSGKTNSELNKGVNADASYSNSENIKENLALKKNTLKTGFSFTNKEITISQRGRPLSGILENVILTATLGFKTGNASDVFAFSNLWKADTLQKAKDIKVEEYTINYINCNAVSDLDLAMKVNYDGALRGVKNLIRGKNIGEFDDKVKFYRISKDNYDIKDLPSISKYEYCNKIFSFTAFNKEEYASLRTELNNINPSLSNNDKKDKRLDITMSYTYKLYIDIRGIIKPVTIYQEDNPEEFLGWINRMVEQASSDNLQTQNFRLYFEKIEQEADGTKKRIWLIKETIKDTDISQLKKLIDITAIEE